MRSLIILMLLTFNSSSFSGEYLGQGREFAITDRDSGESQTIDIGGRSNVVQHAHPDSSTIVYSATLAASDKVILIDLSDTTNFNHTSSDGWAHIESMIIEIDASSNADYVVDIGFLDNVDSTNGDFYTFAKTSGNKSVGVSKNLSFNYYPNGPSSRTSKLLTNVSSLNDTDYQTDVNLKSVISGVSLTTPSGDGDVILDVAVAAGSLTLTLTISYHSDGAAGE